MRNFIFNGTKLADPNPAYTIQQVIDFHTTIYPKMVNSTFETTFDDNGEAIIEIKEKVGRLG